MRKLTWRNSLKLTWITEFNSSWSKEIPTASFFQKPGTGDKLEKLKIEISHRYFTCWKTESPQILTCWFIPNWPPFHQGKSLDYVLASLVEITVEIRLSMSEYEPQNTRIPQKITSFKSYKTPWFSSDIMSPFCLHKYQFYRYRVRINIDFLWK